MRLLLDTHAFLWFITGDRRLSSTARSLIDDPLNEKLLSMASMWEMAIKASRGRLTLYEAFDVLIPREIVRTGLQIVAIAEVHVSLIRSPSTGIRLTASSLPRLW